MKIKVHDPKFNIQNSVLFLFFCLTVLLLSVCSVEAGAKKSDASENGRIVGKIECAPETKGPYGYIGFYFASNRVQDPFVFRQTPDYMFPLEKDGSFDVVLPAGSYYLLANVKGKNNLGPLEGNDYFYFVENSRGGPKTITVNKMEKIDLGVRKATLHPTFGELLDQRIKGITTIKGFLRDEKGNPIEGLLVAAYTQPVMQIKPTHTSWRSGKDGSYSLRLPEGGEYYLAARSKLGGPPFSDEYYGEVEGSKPVVVKTGEVIVDINITVQKIR